MVPVAVNLYKVRKDSGTAGELFRSAQRQKDQYQGLWILSPDGKVLSAHHGFKSDERKERSREVLSVLDAGLHQFGNVSPRNVSPQNPLPYRGTGTRPDGSADFALQARCMHEGKPDGPVVIDTLSVSAAELAAFVPESLELGKSWDLPDSLARKLGRVLSPSSDQSTMPLPDDAKTARLTATINDLSAGQITLRLAGKWDVVHMAEGDLARPIRADAEAEGFAIIDTDKHCLKDLLLVFNGTYRHAPPYDSPRETGAVAEWRRMGVGK
jgi:hypothetical protein